MKKIRKAKNTSRLEFEILPNEPHLSFWKRFLLKFGWLAVFSIAVTTWFYLEKGADSLFLLVPFFLIVLTVHGVVLSRNEGRVLQRLVVDKESSLLQVAILLKSGDVEEMSCSLSEATVKVRQMVLGQVSQPNYAIVIEFGRQVAFTQRGNLVWPSTVIRDMVGEVNSFLDR